MSMPTPATQISCQISLRGGAKKVSRIFYELVTTYNVALFCLLLYERQTCPKHSMAGLNTYAGRNSAGLESFFPTFCTIPIY